MRSECTIHKIKYQFVSKAASQIFRENLKRGNPSIKFGKGSLYSHLSTDITNMVATFDVEDIEDSQINSSGKRN